MNPMKHLPLKELGWAVGFLALLAFLYGVSYWVLLEPAFETVAVHARNDVPEIGAFLAMDAADLRIEPRYRFGGETTRLIYNPVHKLDVWLRPGRWHATLWTR